MEPDPFPGGGGEEPVLSTHSLSRRFGDVAAVSDVSLRVPPGAIYGFLGPNGAGKTTTIRLILGLLRPDSGHVRLFGQDLARAGRSLLSGVGSLVDGPSLYPHLTGRENLEVTRLLLGATRPDLADALETVGLTAAAGRLVSGYSLGMKQRLALAAALLGRRMPSAGALRPPLPPETRASAPPSPPRLLVLDEPSNGLDPAGMQAMRVLLTSLARERGVTLFLSSHLLAEVEQLATHVGILGRGRLLFQGTLEELRHRQSPEVAVRTPEPEKALRILSTAGLSPRRAEDGTLRVPGYRDEEAARVNALLVGREVAVTYLSIVKPDLTEIFLDVTASSGAGEGRQVA